jgi:tetratricopeptide (TPR) repeat protein
MSRLQSNLLMDPYGQVCLGNIAYQQSGTDDDREWERLLKVAFGHYKNVLKIRPSNAYAANGLGVILFERGQFSESRQVFQAVRESLPEMSPACLNLAHTLVSGCSAGTLPCSLPKNCSWCAASIRPPRSSGTVVPSLPQPCGLSDQ